MKIHHLTVEGALASLRSDRQGLSEDEALRRLQEYGLNQVEQVRAAPLIWRFLQSFTHFFAVILWIATGLAFFAEWKSPGEGMATLGFAIMGVIVINGAFSFWQEYRAEQAIAALQKLLPHEVKVLRGGAVMPLPAVHLVPGDVILLEEGDDVPADCRLIEAFGVRVNNATVTGESLPQARNAEPCAENGVLQSRNLLLAGTSLVAGQAQAVVFATGGHTEFGHIAYLTQTAGETLSPLQLEIMSLSRLVATMALGIGILFFFIGQAVGLPFWANFIFAIGIIVANVPEGLLPTVTLALAMGSQRMVRRNALVRHLPAVETLGAATVICTDKTGTLTLNRMTARRLFAAGALRNADLETLRSLRASQHRLFESAALCHNLKRSLKNGETHWLGDPMEIALVRLSESALPLWPDWERVHEIPFDTGRKRMSTLHRTPRGLVLYTKGAPETVLPLCLQVQTANGTESFTATWRQHFVEAQETMAAEGLRILAFAHRAVPDNYEQSQLENGLTLCGLIGLEDPPRPEVPDAIVQCRNAGIRVMMITGDHPHTALAIAREIGLVQSDAPTLISGDQLRRLSPIQLQMALDAPEIIFARVAAEQKMLIVEALRRKKEIVAVTGDGVNDAPALKKADIGIAMGLGGTDVAREAADMILLDDNFASIVAAIEEGRAVFTNIRKFLTYILSSNVPELIPYIAFVLFRIPLPLSIIQILAVDLGTDMLPALALGTEKPDTNVMQQPPRARTERLLNGPLLARAYLFLGAMEAIASLAAYFFVLHCGNWRHGQVLTPHEPLYLQATTACLSAIIVMQIVNVFLCRSEKESAFCSGFFSNPLILWGLALEAVLILLIAYTSWGHALFGTAPLSWRTWLFMLPFAAAMLALDELRKFFVRRAPRHTTGPFASSHRKPENQPISGCFRRFKGLT